MLDAVSQPPITVRRTREEDWSEVRQLRLEMLADTPLAFGETLATAQSLGESAWRERARRGESTSGTSLAAIDPAQGDRWVGTMGGYIDHLYGPMLVGVYVTPAYRGSSSAATALLLAGVEQWAREAHGRIAPGGADVQPALLLHVHTQNPRAIAAYERRGYVDTGKRFPYILNPAEQEMEMRKPL